MFIKICGITRKKDFDFIISRNVDAAGFIAYPKSPRFISPENLTTLLSSESNIMKTGVFVDSDYNFIARYIDAGINIVQLHGDETAEFAAKLPPEIEVWKAIRARTKQDIDKYSDFPADKFLIDAFCLKEKGGTGKTADWDLTSYAVKILKKPVLLAGGLKASNVENAIKTVKPAGIDLSSGVETSPGIKDYNLIEKLLKTARKAFNEIGI